jgi:hypothetical protein
MSDARRSDQQVAADIETVMWQEERRLVQSEVDEYLRVEKEFPSYFPDRRAQGV